ncbi:hypothetical protein HNQ07_002351 [Deinococcus metalli]|uniref:Carboxypeptidase regulatory-like domain-containing protein n=1 Tax=Deinococcus metalli TaxID=1141878 RepID=A0A7W8KEV0_9DEIO|nr:hypothetical protein [Deinococcus metalli]MBB5376887.1 hypothetical protein [Deinococcus metalli]GHF46096.1 hypothetical protein GCM10017781_23150 [Deinococcus metalli]
MPLLPTRPLTLSLLTGLTVLLAACGSTAPQPLTPKPTPQPDPTPSEVSGLIMGKITPFTAGDASSVHEGNGTPADQANGGSLVDASGNLLVALVSDQGQFDLALPKVGTMTSAPDASLLFTVPAVFGSCENSQTTAPSGLKVYPINFLTTDTGKNIVSEIDPSKADLNYRAWWFSNIDATVEYSGNCLGLGKINTSFELKRGWNLLITETNPGVSTTYTVSTQPTSHVNWQYSVSSVGSASIKYPNLLSPWKNLPQYHNR